MNSKKNTVSIVKFIIYFGLVCYLFYINISVESIRDDLIFKEGPTVYGSILEWLKFYINNWSGRIVPHTLLVVVLNMPPFIWGIINWIMMFTLVYIAIEFVIWEYKIKNKDEMFFAFLVATMILIPSSITQGAILWKCASVLYLWGMVGALFALIQFLPKASRASKERFKGVNKFLAVLGAIYASYFEQTFTVMVTFAGIMLVYELMITKKVAKFNVALLGIMIVNGIISLAMPGNNLRSQSEVIAQMPYYDMFSISDKVMWGISFAGEKINSWFGMSLTLISVVVVLLLVIQKKSKRLIYQGAFCIVFSIKAFAQRESVGWIAVDGQTFHLGGFNIVSTFFGISSFILLVILIWGYVSEEKDHISALFLLAAFFELVCMAFTPTIYASDDRVGYVSGILLIIVLFRLLLRLYKSLENKKIE